jgi:hypothetical protein
VGFPPYSALQTLADHSGAKSLLVMQGLVSVGAGLDTEDVKPVNTQL